MASSIWDNPDCSWFVCGFVNQKQLEIHTSLCLICCSKPALIKHTLITTNTARDEDLPQIASVKTDVSVYVSVDVGVFPLITWKSYSLHWTESFDIRVFCHICDSLNLHHLCVQMNMELTVISLLFVCLWLMSSVKCHPVTL